MVTDELLIDNCELIIVNFKQGIRGIPHHRLGGISHLRPHFFSGFGLGTLLLPAFAFFFPVNIAVALTAIVHFLNNLFKLILVGKNADKSIVLKFGLPALAALFLGAQALVKLADLPALFSYQLSGRILHVMPLNLVVALLLIFFALFEVLPRFKNLSFDRKYLPLGGLLSGFFGGLAGHQGALRSAFLIRSGLTKESYIATGVIIACLVDASRLAVYVSHFSALAWHEHGTLLLAATLSTFAGAYLGNRLVQKTTLHAIQVLVSILLFLIAVGLGIGVI